jgi:phosphatidylglycerophosphate synthase
MKHAADACTTLRVLLAPVLAALLLLPRDEAGVLPFLVYAVAAATDYADGALARAAGTASRAGRVFDHGADALLLFPAFWALATQGRIPFVLPIAAITAFSLYLLDGWRRGGSLATIDLTGSRSGAIGGVLNYVVTGAAAAAVALDARPIDVAIYAAAFAIAAVNFAAAFERCTQLVTPARGLPAVEREAQAPRS